MMDATNNHGAFNTTYGLVSPPSIVNKPATGASLPTIPKATTPEADTFESSKPKIPTPTVTADKTPLILSGLSFLTSLAGVGLITWATFFKEPAKATDSVETAVTAAVKPLQEKIEKLVQKPASGGASVDHTRASIVSDNRILNIGTFEPNTPDAVKAEMLINKTTDSYKSGMEKLNKKLNKKLNTELVTTEQIHGFLADLSEEEKKNPALLLEVLQRNDLGLTYKTIDQLSKSLNLFLPFVQNHTETSVIPEEVELYEIFFKKVYPSSFHTTNILQEYAMANGKTPLILEDYRITNHGFFPSFLNSILEKMKNFKSIEDETPAIFDYLMNAFQQLATAEAKTLALINTRKAEVLASPYPFDLKGKAKPTTPQALFDEMPDFNPSLYSPYNTQRVIQDKKNFHPDNITKHLIAIAMDETGLRYDITNPKLLKYALNIINDRSTEQSTELTVFQASAKLLEDCLPLTFESNVESNVPGLNFSPLKTAKAEAALQAFKMAYLDKTEVLDIAQAFIQADIDANKPSKGSAEQIEAYSKAMKEATKNAFKYLYSEYDKLPDAVPKTPA